MTATTRPCRYCDAEVTSPEPDVDYCRACYYQGRWADERFRYLREDLVNVEGFKSVEVWHTGGGCFALGIFLTDKFSEGAHLLLTDEDAGLPATEDGPWILGSYSGDYDSTWGCEGFGYDDWKPLDRAAVLDAVRQLVRLHALAEEAEKRWFGLAKGDLGLDEQPDDWKALLAEVKQGGTDDEILDRFLTPILERTFPEVDDSPDEGESRTILVHLNIELVGSRYSADEVGVAVEAVVRDRLMPASAEGVATDVADVTVALAEEVA